jgi:hypothetical protein
MPRFRREPRPLRWLLWTIGAGLGLYLTRRQARVLARALSLYVIGRALRALSETFREEYP